MMTILGVILLLGGAASAALMYMDITLPMLASIPGGFTTCVVAAIIGALLIYFNMRPGD